MYACLWDACYEMISIYCFVHKLDSYLSRLNYCTFFIAGLFITYLLEAKESCKLLKAGLWPIVATFNIFRDRSLVKSCSLQIIPHRLKFKRMNTCDIIWYLSQTNRIFVFLYRLFFHQKTTLFNQFLFSFFFRSLNYNFFIIIRE